MAVVDGSTLTAAELVALVESDHLFVDAGCDLLDSNDVLTEDISADFIPNGSTVERGIYRTVHGTATLKLSRELQWGSQRLRPFMLLSSDGTTWYRWNLGVFLMAVPERVVDTDVPVWTVECFDKLDVLNVPHLNTYSLPAGSNITDAMQALIEDTGESKVLIEPSDKTAANDRVMSLSDDWTTLGIINELGDSIGYRALHVDREGWYRSEEYVSPTDLGTVWTYSTKSPTTSVAQDRVMSGDYYRAANVIKGIREAVSEDDIPIDGDGIYELQNPADGLTSIAARGRVIPRIIRGEYADHAALVIGVTAALDAEKRVANYVSISVSPTPVHGHFDVVQFRDDAMPTNTRYLVTDWTLPLDGGNCRLDMREV